MQLTVKNTCTQCVSANRNFAPTSSSRRVEKEGVLIAGIPPLFHSPSSPPTLSTPFYTALLYMLHEKCSRSDFFVQRNKLAKVTKNYKVEIAFKIRMISLTKKVTSL